MFDVIVYLSFPQTVEWGRVYVESALTMNVCQVPRLMCANNMRLRERMCQVVPLLPFLVLIIEPSLLRVLTFLTGVSYSCRSIKFNLNQLKNIDGLLPNTKTRKYAHTFSIQFLTSTLVNFGLHLILAILLTHKNHTQARTHTHVSTLASPASPT